MSDEAEDQTVEPVCPNCGSGEIVEFNWVLQKLYANSWAINCDGELYIESDGGDKMIWDAIKQDDPPFACADCDTELVWNKETKRLEKPELKTATVQPA